MSTQLKLGANDTIFLEEFHKIPLVSIVVALRTGNAHEPTGKEGLARITARMTRRGCEGLDAPTIASTKAGWLRIMIANFTPSTVPASASAAAGHGRPSRGRRRQAMTSLENARSTFLAL